MNISSQGFLYLVCSDLYRYYGKVSWLLLLRGIFLGIGFKLTFWYRLCSFLQNSSPVLLPLYLFARLMHRRSLIRLGISIEPGTQIGSGLFIGHFGQIVIHREVRIGKNCNISQGVTIGATYRGNRAGTPVIGDNVYIAAGAKIFGKITVGNNAAIGANCVVTKDVPENAVVAGVPGRIISTDKGSSGYIYRTDYDNYFKDGKNK